ncbi:hypothetical protein U9M48_038149, partial [Paspalum notatum var. saurae]
AEGPVWRGPRPGPTWEYTLFLAHEELSLTLAAEAPRGPSPSVLDSSAPRCAWSPPRLPAAPPGRLPGSTAPSSGAALLSGGPASVPAGRTPQPRSAARRSGLGSRRPPALSPAGSARRRPPPSWHSQKGVDSLCQEEVGSVLTRRATIAFPSIGYGSDQKGNHSRSNKFKKFVFL